MWAVATAEKLDDMPELAMMLVTDLAVLEPTADGLVLRERAPGVSIEAILAATTATLIVPEHVPEMQLTPA